jgi:hypothetical protein
MYYVPVVGASFCPNQPGGRGSSPVLRKTGVSIAEENYNE